MNYFEHHIGDYDKNTAHLTACEDGIYSRMIRRYLDKEKPLEADVSRVERLVRARSKEEKQAVRDVLDEFFELRDDGWHNKTCDEAIEAYQAGEPEREVKKANEENRMKRHREERARLFKVVTDAGQHAPWNVGMNELRELAKRITATPPATAAAPAPVTAPATAPATPATATQTPLPIHQPPIDSVPDGTGGEPPSPPPAPPPAPPPVLVRTREEQERAELWTKGKALLQEVGEAKGAAGAYVGRLIKRWTEPVVIEAMRITVDAPPKNEVKAYLEGLCQRLAGERKPVNKQEALEERNRSIGAAWAAEGQDHAAV